MTNLISVRRKLERAGIKIYPTTNIFNSAHCQSPCHIGKNTFIKNLVAGAYCYIADNNFLQRSEIGCYTTIQEHVCLGLGEHFINEFSSSDAFLVTLDPVTQKWSRSNPILEKYGNFEPTVKIGSDVLIQNEVLCLKDITIGHGAIINAGALLSKDVPPFAIVEGTNKIVGQRFSDEVIADLLDVQWWKYDLPMLIRQGIKVPMQDPKALIGFIKDSSPNSLPLIQRPFLFFQHCLKMVGKTESQQKTESQ